MAAAAPQRIVSLVPSTTESIAAFGAAARLVACTRYCTELAAALRDVVRIGGTKTPDREAILALAPDLVLGNGEENRAEDLAWLGARVRVVVQTPRTVATAIAGLHELAALLGAAGAAAAAPWLAALAALPPAAPAASPLRVYYAIWRKPWMSVNRDTFVHDVLAHCGVINVCAEASARYPECAPADAAARGLDVVLLASEPWSFDAVQRDELAAAGVFGRARLLLCDGRDFCWHGVHMAKGLPRARAVLAALR